MNKFSFRRQSSSSDGTLFSFVLSLVLTEYDVALSIPFRRSSQRFALVRRFRRIFNSFDFIVLVSAAAQWNERWNITFFAAMTTFRQQLVVFGAKVVRVVRIKNDHHTSLFRILKKHTLTQFSASRNSYV